MPKGIYLHKPQSKETILKRSLAMKGRMPKNIKIIAGWNKGKKGCYKLSEETKRKISEHHKKIGVGKWMIGRSGIKSHLWKGGISRDINGNWKSRLWRHKIYKRDDYSCQECGARSGEGKSVYLEAHHIKSWAKFPKERYKLSNGITLCKECHKLTDNYKGKNNKKL